MIFYRVIVGMFEGFVICNIAVQNVSVTEIRNGFIMFMISFSYLVLEEMLRVFLVPNECLVRLNVLLHVELGCLRSV